MLCVEFTGHFLANMALDLQVLLKTRLYFLTSRATVKCSVKVFPYLELVSLNDNSQEHELCVSSSANGFNA
jgi:hypothetical protein